MAVQKTDEKLWKFTSALLERENVKSSLNIQMSFEERCADIYVKHNHLLAAIDKAQTEGTPSLVMELVSFGASIYPLPPPALREFQVGWMHNHKDATNIRNRRKAFASIMRKVGEFLANGIKLDDLPDAGCEGNCHCGIRDKVVGDRGGTPRRVPCQIRDHKGMKMFEESTILMVNTDF